MSGLEKEVVQGQSNCGSHDSSQVTYTLKNETFRPNTQTKPPTYHLQKKQRMRTSDLARRKEYSILTVFLLALTKITACNGLLGFSSTSHYFLIWAQNLSYGNRKLLSHRTKTQTCTHLPPHNSRVFARVARGQ